MAAQRAPALEESAEIFYLVIPVARPVNQWDRMHYALWCFARGGVARKVVNHLRATVGAFGFLGLCLVGLYGLYYLKSILGIDLFGDKHLEDFVPIPGYGRWQWESWLGLK
jgi:hypothetical protein